MKTIEVILTSRCDLKCVYCSSTYFGQVKEFGADTVKKILLWGRKAKAEGVYFGGGEPTLAERLPALIREAKELDYNVIRLLTHGIFFKSRSHLKSFISAGLNEVEISVNSCEAGMSDELTGVKGAFKSQLQGIENIVESRIHLELAVLIHAGNYRHLAKIISYYANFGVRNFTFWLVSLFGLNTGNLARLVPKMTAVVPFLNEAFSLGSEKKLHVRSLHFPACFFEKTYRKNAQSALDMDLVVIEPSGKFKLEDSPFEGGEKPPPCASCSHSHFCLGMRRDYLDIYGDGETKPISSRAVIEKERQ